MRAVEEESSILSWVTIASLIGLIAVGAVVYQKREQFFPSAKGTPRAVLKVSEEVEAKFFEARDCIVGRKYDEASAILGAIDTDQVPQPTRNWITMQNGLARLLAGNLPDARAEFQKVQQRGLYTQDPRGEKLANFFVETARRAASEEPVKAEVAKEFDLDSTEAFGLLVLGLKDWTLGQFEDATALLRQFKSSTPPETEVWLRRYKPIGDRYVESHAAFQLAGEAARGVSSETARDSALAAVRDAKAKVKGQPALLAKLNEMETELSAYVDQKAMLSREQESAATAADQMILDDVKTRVAAYNEKFNFGDALQIVFTATVDGDKAKAELETYLKRAQWLSKFKGTLVSDINAAGYAKPLTKKDSTAIPGGVKSADDTQLLTPAKMAIQWTELASDSVLAMAREFLGQATKPEEVAERKWVLGNFLYQIGRKADALVLLREAAPAKPEYKNGLALFAEK